VTLSALCMALGLLVVSNGSSIEMLLVAGAGGLATAGCYLGDIVILFRSRRRQAVELHMKGAAGAFGMLALGAGLLGSSVWAGSEVATGAAVYVLALGWLSGLGLAMLYKIVAFLTWLECFAPVMGRMPTPRVQDLVAEGRARLGFVLYFLSVLVVMAALLAELHDVARAGLGMQLLAVVFLIGQFYRARRLADLPAQWQDQARPRLLLPARNHRRSFT